MNTLSKQHLNLQLLEQHINAKSNALLSCLMTCQPFVGHFVSGIIPKFIFTSI